MAQTTTLEGLRSQLITSVFGRRLALDSGDYLVGPRAFREQVEGFGGGTTVMSTGTAALSAYGLSMVGSSLTSASTSLTLAAPVPGTKKILFNPTTGVAVITTTGAGAFICSSGSITSTYGTLTFAGKGANIELFGLTTALWGVSGVPLSSVSTMVTIV